MTKLDERYGGLAMLLIGLLEIGTVLAVGGSVLSFFFVFTSILFIGGGLYVIFRQPFNNLVLLAAIPYQIIQLFGDRSGGLLFSPTFEFSIQTQVVTLLLLVVVFASLVDIVEELGF